MICRRRACGSLYRCPSLLGCRGRGGGRRETGRGRLTYWEELSPGNRRRLTADNCLQSPPITCHWPDGLTINHTPRPFPGRFVRLLCHYWRVARHSDAQCADLSSLIPTITGWFITSSQELTRAEINLTSRPLTGVLTPFQGFQARRGGGVELDPSVSSAARETRVRSPAGAAVQEAAGCDEARAHCQSPERRHVSGHIRQTSLEL